MCFGRLAKLAVKTCAFRCGRSVKFPYSANFRRKFTMAIGERKSWRELCHVALEARDRNELLALKHEEQARRDFREVRIVNKSSGEVRG